MAKSLSNSTPIKNIAASPPTRRSKDDDGVMVVEKLNPMRVNRKMVHPDGDVVVISLATGWTVPKMGPGWGLGAFRGNPYGAQIMIEKIEQGFIPFDECPLANKLVKPKQGEKPCEGAFSDEKCCPHLDRVIQSRRAAHRKTQEANRQKSMKTEEKVLEHIKMGLAVPAKGKGPLGE